MWRIHTMVVFVVSWTGEGGRGSGGSEGSGEEGVEGVLVGGNWLRGKPLDHECEYL